MPINKVKGRYQFEFKRTIGDELVRCRKTLPRGWTRAQADAYDVQESAAIYARATGVSKPVSLIDHAVGAYEAERAPTLKHGAGAVREIMAMQDWWAGQPISALPDVCAEYAADQHGALAPATIKNRIAYLRAACRYAWKRHNMGEGDPGARVEVPTVRNERKVTVTRAQMVALCRACRHRGVRALIRVLYYSAMRVSEAQRAIRAGDAYILYDTKNGDSRSVPIHPKARVASTVPMPRRSEIDYYWPLAREACGLAGVRLHDIRHTAVSAMVNAGVQTAVAGAVAGHRSAQSMKRYTHLADETLAAALGRIK